MEKVLRSSSPPINPESPLNHVLICLVPTWFFCRLNPPAPSVAPLQILPQLCALLWSHSSPSMSLWGAQNWTQDLRCGRSSAKFYRWHIHSLSGSLVQCLTTLTTKSFLLMPSLTLLSFCLKPLSCHSMALSQVPLQSLCSTFRCCKVSPDCFS